MVNLKARAVKPVANGAVMGTIDQYLGQVSTTLANLPLEAIMRVINELDKARESGRRVYIFGNGGSAATASHFACDLSKGAICGEKSRIKAYSLTDNVSLLSAWANDTAYDNIFAEQLGNLVEETDVVIGISGSGNSPNVLNGIKAAKARGAVTVGFSGFYGGKLKDIVDIAVVVPNHTMEQVEDIHLLVEHIITTCLRSNNNHKPA